MEHFFLVRHGRYNHDGESYHLSPQGKSEIEYLSKLIREISGDKFYICTSPEIVAIESARVIATDLGASINETMDLWSGSLGPVESNVSGDPKRVHNYLMPYLIGSKSDANSLIAITHLEIVRNYPEYFIRNEFGKRTALPLIEKGQMMHFDIEQQTYKLYTSF